MPKDANINAHASDSGYYLPNDDSNMNNNNDQS